MSSTSADEQAPTLKLDPVKLCELLELDPAEVKGFTIEVEAGSKRAVLRWESVRRVPLDRLLTALEGATS